MSEEYIEYVSYCYVIEEDIEVLMVVDVSDSSFVFFVGSCCWSLWIGCEFRDMGNFCK